MDNAKLNELLRKKLGDPNFDCENWAHAGKLYEDKCHQYLSISKNSVSTTLFGDSYKVEREPTPAAICEGFLVWSTVNDPSKLE